MANVKITGLTAITAPANTDVLPIVDVSADVTKKVSIADLLESAGDGTAALPAFAFDSDKDIGMYRVGANQLGFATAGTSRIVVDSSGLVSVAGGVHVTENVTPTAGSGVEIFKPTSTTGQIQSYNRGSSAWMDLILKGNTQQFHANGSERMRIDSSGRLIVGRTASVTSGSAADSVVQIVGKKGSPTDLGQLTIARGNSASALGSGAELGEIIFSDNTGGNFAQIQCNTDAASGTNDYPGRLSFHTTANGASLPTERMRIDSSGRVGINNSSPAATLSVDALAGNSTVCLLKSPTVNAFLQLGNSSNDQGYLGYQSSNLTFYTAGSERMRLASDGTLVIGRTTSSDPNRYVQMHNGSAASSAYLQSTNTGTGSGATDGIVMGMGDSTNAYFWNYEAGAIVFGSNSAERMRIDSSGRVMIGTTAPANSTSFLSVVNTSGDAQVVINSGPTSESVINMGDTGDFNIGAIRYNQTDNAFRFFTSNVEHMRLTNGGEIFMNSTGFTATVASINLNPKGSGDAGRINLSKSTNSARDALALYSQGSYVGGVVYNAASTSFQTSSDYRLKENVVDLTAAIPRLKTLPVYRFNFITDSETTVDGFLAHEAQLVVPEAVTGVKDEVDNDGNAVMQGIDQSKLVPLLTAALQEAITKIETLEAKVASLEAG